MSKPILFDTSMLTYTDGPDYHSLGFGSATLVSQWGLHATLPDGSVDYTRVDPETCRYCAYHPTWWVDKKTDMIVLDEESLDHFHPDARVRDEHHDQLIEAIRIYRKAHPGLAIGCYGIMPQRSYASIQAKSSPDYKAWQKRNKMLLTNIDNETGKTNRRGLSSYVDRICCSCYGWDSFENWEKYTRNSITEAAIYDKPIFVYLCPQKEADGFPFYNEGTWGRMLEMVLENKLVDGIIVYQVLQAGDKFDESARWWKETLKVAA